MDDAPDFCQAERMSVIMATSYTLDKTRAKQRAEAHFPARIHEMLDFVRAGLVFDSIDDYDVLYEKFARSDTFELVDVRDRFRAPSPTGFRDLKFYLADRSTGHISTARCISTAMIESQTQCLPHEAMMNIKEVEAVFDEPTHFAVITDNFRFNEPDALTVVSGFEDLDDAIHYAKLRTYEKMRSLLSLAKSTEELRLLWFLFGEDAVSAKAPYDGMHHVVSLQMDSMLLEAPLPRAQDWTRYGHDRIELTYQPLHRFIDSEYAYQLVEDDDPNDGDDESIG